MQGSESAWKGAVGPEARVHEVQMDIVAGEGQAAESDGDGAVDAVEGGRAEEDKGIEEGKEGGFVVVARDGKVRGESVSVFLGSLLPMIGSRRTQALACRTTVARLVSYGPWIH